MTEVAHWLAVRARRPGYRPWARTATTVLGLSVLAGCGDTSSTAPESARRTISDAVHSGGTAGFFFLPPLVQSPLPTGAFDASLSPTVSVCEWSGSACGQTIAQFTTSGGTGAQSIRVDPATEHYIVNWDTRTCSWGDCTLDPTKYYRISVSAGGRELGFADVDVVRSGSELRNVSTNDYIGLLNGRTLPVKFRIESGIPASIAVTPASATLRVGESQQFTTSITDLHGQPLAGAVVSWSSSTAAAEIDASGLATAAQGGAAILTASFASLSASATVEVIEPVARLELAPAAVSILTGQTVQFIATTYASNGSVLTGRLVAFSSDNGGVVTVDEAGLVSGIAAGTATIQAESEGQIATAQVVVATPGFTLKANTITAGNWHSCGLSLDGEAYCWGMNDYGQLGQGYFSARTTRPVKVIGGHVFTSIGAGSSYTCGMTADREIWCWGQGNSGQLGNGAFQHSNVPVKVQTSVEFEQVSVGGGHVCALTADGTPYCWGWNDSNRLATGGPSLSIPTAINGGHRFTAITAGVHSTCAIKSDDSVWCWGNSGAGPSHTGPLAVANGTLKLRSVSVGADHACGIGVDGLNWCWGNNSSGQFGNGTTTSTYFLAPVQGAPSSQFASLHASLGVTCGLTVNGEAFCWGTSAFGQLGNGSTGTSLSPVRVASNSTLGSLTTGNQHHACAVAVTGSVYCWGYNGHGGLGDGTTTNRALPTQVIEP